MKISKDLKEFLRVLIGVFVLCFIVIFSMFYLFEFFKEKACELKTRDFIQSEYTFLTGCMVREDKKWIPLSNVRSLENE
jgi:hypothetical protein